MTESYISTQELNKARDVSDNENTLGFDHQAGQSWIYPSNYPIREYQFNITQEALYKNTLVSLPTGLGKTFIAAVIMYNFYRWYPNGKIIFIAPTRPLVKQQIDACYNITAIPQETTAELTGTKLQASRQVIWQTKRVFFVTPQVLQNDLDNMPNLGKKIRCLVFDEAHRAKGNHAYCEVIRKLMRHNTLFRVLALSATPGNSIKDVLEVISNLLIAHLEFRTEESLDVKKYVFQRSLETIVVPLGDKLYQVKEEYLKVLETYTRSLISYNVLNGNYANISKGKIFIILKEFQAKHVGNRDEKYKEILKNLNICVSLYHAYEVLQGHGLRGFLNFFEDHITKPLLKGNVAVIKIMNDIRSYLGPMPNFDPLPDGSYPEPSPNTKYGHPKFYHLRNILTKHFTESEPDSRVIVFFEYRESVMEAYALLRQSQPTVKPRIFLGQGSGITQKIQISVIKAFREGKCNTLLSTSIGEEGLDVGEVNLIVCFDVSNKSPIRMIQRMGRTGRKKAGKVVILVTEGKEQQTLNDCLTCKSNLNTFVLNSPQLLGGMYANNLRMVPDNIQPQCQKLFITVEKKAPVLKNSTLRDFLQSANKVNLNGVEVVQSEERLPNKSKLNCLKSNLDKIESKPNFLTSLRHIERQRTLQSCAIVKHSKRSEIFVDLLKFADAKRFNMPISENETKKLKQSDIRSMFLKQSQPDEDFSQRTVSLQIQERDDFVKRFPPNLFMEMITFLTLQPRKECKTCKLLKCPRFLKRKEPRTIFNNWIQPDFSIVEKLTGDDLDLYSKSLQPNGKEIIEFESANDFDDVDFDQIELNTEKNIQEQVKEDELEDVIDNSFAFQLPANFKSIASKMSIVQSSQVVESVAQTYKVETTVRAPINNLELNISEDVIDTTAEIDEEEILRFFKLDKLQDIYVDSNVTEDLDATIIYSQTNIQEDRLPSPDLFSESPDIFTSLTPPKILSPKAESPILSSLRSQSMKKRHIKKEATNKSSDLPIIILDTPEKTSSVFDKTPSSISCTPRKVSPKSVLPISLNRSIEDKSAKRSLFRTGLLVTKPNLSKLKSPKANLNISDLCDLDCFGLGEEKVVEKETVNKEVDDFDISDFCDLSIFNKTDTICNKPCTITKASSELDIDQLCENVDKLINEISESPVQKKQNETKINESMPDGQKAKSETKNDVFNISDYFGPLQGSHPNANILPQVSTSQKENTTPTRQTNARNSSEKQKRNILQLKPHNNQCSTPFRKHKPVSTSDDEFEDFLTSPIFAKPQTSAIISTRISSKNSKLSLKSNIRKKPAVCEFLDEEAILSGTEKASDDEEESGSDEYEMSFVANESECLPNTQMHLQYLKSVRSPRVNRGRFKIPDRPKNDVSYIFSQVPEQDETYANDSFCVDEEEISTHNELSELDILEAKLKEQRRNKRRQNAKAEAEAAAAKRRRIIVISSDSE